MNIYPKLQLFKEYTRKDVHDIFDPSTRFSTGAGTWGIHGIVQVPNREKDYVFFVTFGRSISGYDFKESITDDGVLLWQSQRRHRLSDKVIQNFINHDYLTDNIYLFLRTEKEEKIKKDPKLLNTLENLLTLIMTYKEKNRFTLNGNY